MTRLATLAACLAAGDGRRRVRGRAPLARRPHRRDGRGQGAARALPVRAAPLLLRGLPREGDPPRLAPRARLRRRGAARAGPRRGEGDASQLRHDLGARRGQEPAGARPRQRADARPRRVGRPGPSPAGRVPRLRRRRRLPLRPARAAGSRRLPPGRGAHGVPLRGEPHRLGGLVRQLHDVTGEGVRRDDARRDHAGVDRRPAAAGARRRRRLRRDHRVRPARLGGDVPGGPRRRAEHARLDALAAAGRPGRGGGGEDAARFALARPDDRGPPGPPRRVEPRGQPRHPAPARRTRPGSRPAARPGTAGGAATGPRGPTSRSG